MPEGMGPLAVAYWKEVVEKLSARGAICSLDRIALEMLCRAIQEEHDLTVEASNHDIGKNAWTMVIGARNKARQQIERGCKQFGLTPMDRPRIQTATPPDPNDRKRALLKAPRPLRINPGA